MDNIDEISKGLKKIASQFGPDIAEEATVTAVDTSQFTADLKLENGAEYFEVQLRAVIGNNNSVEILPKVGSLVLVSRIDEDTYFVLACDEITSYKVTVGKTVSEITADGHLIKKDNETLKKILEDLIAEVLKIGAYKDIPSITAIKQRLNTLLK